MKNALKLSVWMVLLIGLFSVAEAQTGSGSWNTGADLVSSYVGRGTKFGSGPAFQPTVEFTKGIFTIGAWGSYCFSDNEAMETDLYLGLTTSSGLGFNLTDYYFPATKVFSKSSHFLEPTVSFATEKFSLLAAYMVGDEVNDLYFEADVKTRLVNLTIGAGDGAYTRNGKFNICNVGINTVKEVKITDSFSLPLSGSLILNPSSEQMFIVFGISL
jgi:hypothetical protein